MERPEIERLVKGLYYVDHKARWGGYIFEINPIMGNASLLATKVTHGSSGVYFGTHDQKTSYEAAEGMLVALFEKLLEFVEEMEL